MSESTKNPVAVSVCVAIYNLAPYLRECLNSLLEQTLLEAEFLLIDDGSTDNSTSICQEFVNRDCRFKLIKHSKNLGSLKTRKSGIEYINGKYGMFLDGDDFLPSKTALEDAYKLIEKNNTDILRFTTKIFSSENIDLSPIDNWINGGIKNIFFSSKEYLDLVYSKTDHSWNIWNKIYSSNVLKASLTQIPDEHFVCGEDAFLTFLFAANAKSIISLDTPAYYAYRVGTGVSTSRIDLNKYINHYSKEVRCTRWMKQVVGNLKNNDVDKVINNARSMLMTVNCHRLNELSFDERAKGFDALVAEDFNASLITTLAKVNDTPESMSTLARALYQARSLSIPKRKVKTIGFLYTRYFQGGVERVMSLQIPLFLKLGYRVILLTEEIAPEKEFPLPKEVQRAQLPSSYSEGRAEALEKTIAHFDIDLVMIHKASSWDILWDLLILRLNKIHTILTLHEEPFQAQIFNPTAENFKFDSSRPYFYRFANYLITLTRAVATYYAAFDVRAVFIPNPISFDIETSTTIPKANERAGVYWIGRLDQNQKNYRSALNIFRLLISKDPHCQCFIVGPEFTKNAGSEILSFIHDNKLENNLHWIGNSRNVQSLLKKARVLCVTSRFESFSMLLIEAKSCGTPVVMYDLPYLEIVQSKKGIISIAQDDIEGAARKLQDILEDDALCNRLVEEQISSLRDFYKNYDVSSSWENILNNPDQSFTPPHDIRTISKELEAQNEFIKKSFEARRLSSINLKRIYHLKSIKYFLLGKLFPSHKRRIHYRKKLAEYIFGL